MAEMYGPGTEEGKIYRGEFIRVPRKEKAGGIDFIMDGNLIYPTSSRAELRFKDGKIHTTSQCGADFQRICG